jgi:uncharacterized membrane protein YqjE
MNNSTATSPLASIGLGQILPAIKILADAMLHRGELTALELAEARDHIFVTILIGLAAIAVTLLGGFTVTVTLAIAVWDSPDRVLVLGLVSAVYLVGGGLLIWFSARRIQSWRPFKEIRKQLRCDHVCLHTLVATPPSE